jgi:hypothetical protein
LGLSLTSSFADELTSRSIKLKTQNLDVIPWNLLLNSNDKWIRAHNNYVLGENGSEIFRLTLDYEEDYDFLNMLATKFGPNVNRYELEHFLFLNPKINSMNSFRTEDFLMNKGVQLNENFD